MKTAMSREELMEAGREHVFGPGDGSREAPEELVHVLREEHRRIGAALDTIREKGVSTREGVEVLLAMREYLLSHMKKEDSLLYPSLRRRAETDRNLARILKVFARDTRRISAFAERFFTTYAKGGDAGAFFRDFGKLVSMVRSRISREEKVLFTEYRRLQSS